MLGGNLHLEDNLHLEGNLCLAGNLMLGGSLRLEPIINLLDRTFLQILICGTFLFQEIHSSLGDIILKVYNNLLFLKELIHILLMDKMFTPLYGKPPNPTYNPQNPSGYTPLTHVSQTPSNPVYSGQQKPYAEDPMVIIIHLTQCMVLLVFLCTTSITHRLTDNYLSLLHYIS
jgi:hypothetical protein